MRTADPKFKESSIATEKTQPAYSQAGSSVLTEILLGN